MKKLLLAPDPAAGGAQQQQQQEPSRNPHYKKILKRLGLGPEADEDEVMDAVEALLDKNEVSEEEAEQKARINKRVVASGGALNAKSAATVEAHQAAFDSSALGKQYKKAAARK